MVPRARRCGMCEGCVVASLPDKVALSPEVMGLGISVTNIAFAESTEDLHAAFEAIREKILHLDDMLERVKSDVFRIERELLHSDGRRLKAVLQELQEYEVLSALMYERTQGFLDRLKAREVLAHVTYLIDDDEIRSFFHGWRYEHLPFIRRARLSVIVLVFHRAQERGLEGAQLDAGFAEWFIAAPFEETGSWQETACLLAVPENADRLLRSIHMASRDRTDQIPGLDV